MDATRKKRKFTTFDPSPHKEVKKQMISSPRSCDQPFNDEDFEQPALVSKIRTHTETNGKTRNESSLFPLDWSIKTSAKFTSTETFDVRSFLIQLIYLYFLIMNSKYISVV